MEEKFPNRSKFFKNADFQDKPITLTYLGYEKIANEDDPPTKKNAKSWADKLKYMLPYSYPEWATDSQGNKIKNASGEAFKNRYYDERFPKGFYISYVFAEGKLDSGSRPLYEAFCVLQPTKGDRVMIERTGQGPDTRWSVDRVIEDHAFKKAAPFDPENMGEMQPDEDVPF